MFCEKLAGTLGCMRRESAKNSIPLDHEIKRTLKRILRDNREVARMEQLPMGPMEDYRDDDVGSIRGASIDSHHLGVLNQQNLYLIPPLVVALLL